VCIDDVQPQSDEVEHLSNSSQPIEAVQVRVVLETSPAVYLISDQHLAAAYALVQGPAPDDQGAPHLRRNTKNGALVHVG
jgi:hypothetical protein